MQGLEFLPTLVATVEKAGGQSTASLGTQYQIISEAVYAACLIVKLLTAEVHNGKRESPCLFNKF